MRGFASAVASLALLFCVAAGEAQVGTPADWLPYEVSSEMPRRVEPAALDTIRSGMTLGQVVELLGKGWIPPNSGTGTITWGCTDGRNLKVKPRRYTKDEVVSFEQREGDAARMSIERSLPARAAEAGVSRHAYYLFLASAPQSCEDCYVPLLIVPQTLEDVAASGRDATVVLITTYERDSIWTVERGVSLEAAEVVARERIVRLRGRRYRYQEVAAAEVLRLLENPRGTAPIHRVLPVPDKASLEDLIAAFRARN